MEKKEETETVKEPLPIARLAMALSRAQAVMSGAKKDKVNPFFKSNYSDLASVFEALREPFAENGLCISQTMEILPGNRTALTTHLIHESGENITSTMLLPDIKEPQKLGSCMTYYKRYALQAIAGLPSEDDDGQSANQAVKKQALLASSDQITAMKTALRNVPDYESQVFRKLESEYGTCDLCHVPANLVQSILLGAKEASARNKGVSGCV